MDEHQEWREQLKAAFKRQHVDGEKLVELDEHTIAEMKGVDGAAAKWFADKLTAVLQSEKVEYE